MCHHLPTEEHNFETILNYTARSSLTNIGVESWLMSEKHILLLQQPDSVHSTYARQFTTAYSNSSSTNPAHPVHTHLHVHMHKNMPIKKKVNLLKSKITQDS